LSPTGIHLSALVPEAAEIRKRLSRGGQLVLVEQIEEYDAVLEQLAYGWRVISGLLPSV
jgi:hypothetical protein